MQFGIEVEINVGHFYHFLVASGLRHSTRLCRWSSIISFRPTCEVDDWQTASGKAVRCHADGANELL
ncbi:hypothetical protein [Rhizobium leguminosarum]|uniref:hypothetical protein n=1 Tax=Rhizobium leguminosarum TaxID=384 RepID=UPI0003A85251|nr:hypothetical protein [Rhizobium leguminosarum]NKK44401.1 hypothetical protein [Rhizobium leguminosarum bv. viciae]